MRKPFTILLAGATALFTVFAHAASGLTQLPSIGCDGPIAVFYPSDAKETTLQRGPFAVRAALQGTAVHGNGRLVVLSHGSGGSGWELSDLARQLVAAGFVVAIPEHAGDNWHDMGKVGPESWKIRPLEVSRAIDAVGKDVRLAPLLELDKVGMFGMSAGGHTALTLAGGRWSKSRLLEHCQAELARDFVGCTGAASELDGGALDGIKKRIAMLLIRWKLDGDDTQYGHTDPRIRAVVAGVPFAVDFDLRTLAEPAIALGIVQAERDQWLLPRFHSGPLMAACKHCELLASLPAAGHGALLSPLPHGLPARVQRLLDDPPGFDRGEMPAIHQRITDFFRRQLLN